MELPIYLSTTLQDRMEAGQMPVIGRTCPNGKVLVHLLWPRWRPTVPSPQQVGQISPPLPLH